MTSDASSRRAGRISNLFSFKYFVYIRPICKLVNSKVCFNKKVTHLCWY